MEQNEAGTGASEEGGDVSRCGWVGVDVFEVPIYVDFL